MFDCKLMRNLVDSIALNYHLQEGHTIVESKMTISKKDASSGVCIFRIFVDIGRKIFSCMEALIWNCKMLR